MSRVLPALACLCLAALAEGQQPNDPAAGSAAPAQPAPGEPHAPPPGFYPGTSGPVPDVPVKRTASGKPDFSGVWGHNFFYPGDKDFYPMAPEMPDLSMMKPWSRTEYVRLWRLFKEGKQVPNTSMLCLPAGATSVMMEAHALQVIQTEKEIIFLAESDHQVRIVYINGRHPANLAPSWYGDAVAHWEGDDLVIDTVGMNDKSQIDPLGVPHSAALHMVERLSIKRDGGFDDFVTLDDFLTFEHPYSYHYHYSKDHIEAAQAENVGEYACAENNRDGYLPPVEPSPPKN